MVGFGNSVALINSDFVIPSCSRIAEVRGLRINPSSNADGKLMLRSMPLSSGVTGGKLEGESVPAGGTVCGVGTVPGVAGFVEGVIGVDVVSGITRPLPPEDGGVTPGVTAGVKPLGGTGFCNIEGGVVCIPGPWLERLDFIFAGAGLVTDGGFEPSADGATIKAEANAKRLSELARFENLPEIFLVSRKMSMNHGPSGKPRTNGV